MPGTGYYFSALSTATGSQYVSSNFFFLTTNYTTANLLFDVTNVWTYTTSNLDGMNWTAPGYDDSGWMGSGPGLLWVDNRGPNMAIPAPLTTDLPLDPGTGYPYYTYYFRTHFSFTNSLSGVSLLWSNYVDDGAVFYLGGSEIYRLRMDPYPTPIYNSTLAAGYPCSNNVPPGDATCPDLFSISGDLTTNLFAGDNVLAVEVHNYNALSPDVTFGTALFYTEPYVLNPQLNLLYSNGIATLSWTRGGFTLQQAGTPAGPWTNTPGPVVSSPFTPPLSAPAMFFRLIK